MDKVEIIRYDPALHRALWDAMVDASRNGTFLFRRGFMDYHADRFRDHSLIALNGGKPVALLPANEAQGILHSHQGLTYGGWVLPQYHFEVPDMQPLFDAMLDYCAHNGIRQLVYKPVPYIYHLFPSQDDLYFLTKSGAALTNANIASVIDLRAPRRFNTLQRRHLRRAEQAGATVRPISVEEFYPLLADCLQERHGATPLHSLEELTLLAGRFPDHIHAHGALCGERLCAAILIFETPQVAHCQYIATSPEGRANGALTLLVSRLLEQYASKRYFDLGTSNEDQGRLLNEGLSRQKGSLGGTGVLYPTYRLTLAR